MHPDSFLDLEILLYNVWLSLDFKFPPRKRTHAALRPFLSFHQDSLGQDKIYYICSAMHHTKKLDDPYACTSQKVPPLSAQIRIERSGIFEACEVIATGPYGVDEAWHFYNRDVGPIPGLRDRTF